MVTAPYVRVWNAENQSLRRGRETGLFLFLKQGIVRAPEEGSDRLTV
jgi:hypothetical protein